MRGQNILPEIEIIKSMMLNSFLFVFWDEMNYFWKAFDNQLKSFFKPQKVIFWAFGIFLVATVLYSIINFLIIRKMSKQTTNLVLILYELNKDDVAEYLQRIQKFQNLLSQYEGIIRPGNEEQLDFSSDDDFNPKFDKKIQKQSKELREKQSFKKQVICEFIRFAQQKESCPKFP